MKFKINCFYIVYFIKILLIIDCVCSFETNGETKPNIIFILADDLGWNDVGFHGSSQIPTPNIDAMAYSGIILNNYYVTAICTPSRSALMTGKHPIHTGMQHTVLYGAEPRGLPLTEKLLPEYLKKLGYSTHAVGKWHLGHYKKEYTPLHRGFDSHLGYWTGHQDYNDHTAVENHQWGLDMRQNMEVAWDLHGRYSTDVFTNEAERLIANHNTTKPLFLYLAHLAVHSSNPYNPLPAPDEEVAKFRYIPNYSRSRYAAMLSKLDESVGKVVRALQRRNMLENSIVVFTTDNGGPAEGFNLNAASNWPLRGVKNTLWEGGVRGAAFLWSPLINQSQRIAAQRMHISDWLPTLYYIAGGNPQNLGNIDGVNLWNSVSQNEESPRKEILHNIDDIYGNSALTNGDWKIVKGSTYAGSWDSWYGPSGRGGEYDVNKVLSSFAGVALSAINKNVDADEIIKLRKKAEITCSNKTKRTDCKPLVAPCLFNIDQDPCEQQNLANEFPEILEYLKERLEEWNATAVPPGNLPLDPQGFPQYWNYTWTNFGDFIDK